MRLIASTLAFVGSCLMLGLMVDGHTDPAGPHYYLRRQFDFAQLWVILTGLAFFACLITSFIPKDLRAALGQRVVLMSKNANNKPDTEPEA